MDALLFEPRKEDQLECERYGLSLEYAIKASLNNSMEARVFEVGGKVAAIWGWGVNSFMSDTAVCWLLTTPIVDRHPKLFVEQTRLHSEALLVLFKKLEALVDLRYDKTIRWLTYLGWTRGRDDREGFAYFERTR